MSSLAIPAPLDFELPPKLEATEPIEARGLPRDAVRLMVSHRADNSVIHGRFTELPLHLRAGDVLAVNTSGTLNAAISGHLPDGRDVEVHLSTHLPGDIWTVELRERMGGSHVPLNELAVPTAVRLAGDAVAHIHARHHCGCGGPNEPTRLWTATLDTPVGLLEYLERYGSPIRYSYVKRRWASSLYQTVFADEPGSAEMPSAGRAFTPRVLEALGRQGVQLAPLVLHTGVASPEAHEPPYEEYFRVPEQTARMINRAHEDGRPVIAVGTTVVRALETVADPSGLVSSGEGWTCTVITPERGVHAVDGLLTGFHEPRASHLLMLEAIAGREHLRVAYDEALQNGYLWHEFGDVHLIL